jgi:predicted phage tail protein
MCRNHSHIVADHIGVAMGFNGRMEILRVPQRMEVQQPYGPAWMLKAGSVLIVPCLNTANYFPLVQALMGGLYICSFFRPEDGTTLTAGTVESLIPSYDHGLDSSTDGVLSVMLNGGDDDVPF